MKINRRNALLAAVSIAAAPAGSGQAQERKRRVSQQELDEAIRLHGIWLTDISCGARCMFGGRDLSGLQFSVLRGGPVDLNGADFAEADLSGTEADDILVHHCNFNGAKFDRCRWRQPVFSFADMRRVSAKAVEWGNSTHRGTVTHYRADFRHTTLTDADLTDARVCGYFYGARLGGASLVRADFSRSDFLGPMHHEMSFAGTQLTDAKLRHCNISSVSFFNADCSGTDFSHSFLSELRMKGCNLSRARFHGVQIERTTFSTEQINQGNLRQYVG